MKEFAANLPFDLATQKPLEVKFSGLDLSSDAGLLLVKQAEENLKVCEGIADCLEDNREQHKVKHTLFQLVSQRIYQIIDKFLQNHPEGPKKGEICFWL